MGLPYGFPKLGTMIEIARRVGFVICHGDIFRDGVDRLIG